MNNFILCTNSVDFQHHLQLHQWLERTAALASKSELHRSLKVRARPPSTRRPIFVKKLRLYESLPKDTRLVLRMVLPFEGLKRHGIKFVDYDSHGFKHLNEASIWEMLHERVLNDYVRRWNTVEPLLLLLFLTEKFLNQVIYSSLPSVAYAVREGPYHTSSGLPTL